ncbi:Transcriptional regulatory protein moc3-like protein 4 [Colletotrichum chlorophyti]|uniref:Transcriptional regulatory protein moc3-like protein 4 n=1 Tax=Colletotrichum chlorophyti TaxID=708187 RepID=A0A1Q8RXQ4_9PEZI|nr:Transcriptional regulatory protein moc3-like protein 4 [Colletotrichum chlorophyti]
MARRGTTKVRTGCITCKLRRVKCDEARPSCNRCTSTGRKCDGYAKPPNGSYSWSQLLWITPPPTQTASQADLRALSFFHNVVAPGLTGPMDNYFWTHLVSQVSHQEEAAKHAALAISSLYENFKEDPLDRSGVRNAFAMAHYNQALKCLMTTNNHETVLVVCILFICIEMLRGECKSAIDHCRHGITILNGASSKSRFVREQLEPIFCRLEVFPFFFGSRPETFPTVAAPIPALETSFSNLIETQAALDPLLVHAIRFVLRGDAYRLGDELSPKPDASTLQERGNIDAAFDKWFVAFRVYQKQKARERRRGNARTERIFECMLEMTWLVGKLWIDTCLSRGETVFDLHLDKFRAIVALARQAEALLAQTETRCSRPKFMFEMGFTPLLSFVVIKCRSLSLRIAALRLMKSLAHEKENLWELNAVLAFGHKTIEVEHDLCLAAEENLQDDADDGTLPPEIWRIKDAVVHPEAHVKLAQNGVVTMERKVAFFMKEPEGPITVREERFSVTLGHKG